jgi:corrinoid protein of di/trimethylamine methyltransferase
LKSVQGNSFKISVPSFADSIANAGRVFLLDGGMGTMIHQYDLVEEDFGGYPGCNDYLCVSKPEIIQDIHRRYLSAGSDIIETNTFSAQRVSLKDWGVENEARSINIAAARVARQIADAFTLTNPQKPRYVVGSIGPTNKTCSFSSDGSAPLDYNELKAAYKEQIDALAEGGVDGILIETIFDTLNAKAAIEAAQDVHLPIMLSFAQVNAQGLNMNGQDVFAFIEDICRKYEIFSVGLNCSSGAAQMAPIIQDLASRVKCYVSAYPNAGIPNAKGKYEQTGEEFARQCWSMLDSHSVNIIGGCCGTTDSHIAALQPLIEPAPGCFTSPKSEFVAKPRYKKLIPTVPDAPKKEEKTVVQQESNSSSDPKERLLNAIVAGKQEDALEATKAALEEGADATSLINNQMICAMGLVGKNFEEGKAFVPQLLMAGRAMKAALGYIKQHEAANGKAASIQAIGKVVIGTVKGDLHDIGKNLVASMLEGSGFEVVNIGIDIDADTFVKAVVDNHADILCLSALLTTTMTYMKDVLDALEKAGIRDKVKVMVGGAPVSQQFADEIGADGYSSNANEAVTVAKKLLNIN